MHKEIVKIHTWKLYNRKYMSFENVSKLKYLSTKIINKIEFHDEIYIYITI